MQMSRLVALALLASACTPTGRAGGPRAATKGPLRGGVAEFQVISYDGRVLDGRVLVGATIDTLVIDGRLYEWWDVEVDKIRECGKKELVQFSTVETFRRAPRPDEIVTLRSGYWYGGKMSFLLANDEGKGINLECFEAELVVLARGSRVAARQSIRVVRTDTPKADEPARSP